MATVVEVSQGEARYVWVRVTESNGAALDAGAVQVSLTPLAGGVHDWIDPDDTDQVSSSVVRVAVLVDDRFDEGKYKVRAKVTDNPEAEIVHPSNSSVTVR